MRSSFLRGACAILAITTVATGALAQAPAGTRLSFTEAIDRAETAPDVEVSEQSVTIARRQLAMTKARRWARVDVDANVIMWDDEQVFDIIPTGPNPMPGGEPLIVRERVTYSTSVTVLQPLSAQIPFQRAISLDEAAVDAAEATHEGARLDVVQAAAETYLRLLLARAGRDIAATRVQQLEAQIERVTQLVAGGAAQRVDVMRLEATLASARYALLQAEEAVEGAAGTLALILGMPLDSKIEPIGGLPDEPAPPPYSRNEAADAAEKEPEVIAAQARAKQAYYASRVSLVNLYPGVNALGTYQYNHGMGTFQPETAWFVGVNLTWNIWDWGTTWKGYKVAKARTHQAELAADRQTEQSRHAARQAALAANTAYQAIAVAKVGLDAAEEAYRIQNARYGEGAATTTDLLDAETDVFRARLGSANARYQYFIALVQLDRAMGRTPGRSLAASRSK